VQNVACLAVWDTVTCTEVKQVSLGLWEGERDGPKLRQRVGCVALGPDGRLVACAVGSDVKILDTGSWRGKVLLRHDGYVNSLSFSPDGKRLLAGGTKSVWLWDLESGEKKTSTFKAITFKGGEPSWSADIGVTFSANGERIAFNTYDGKEIHTEVWNVSTPKPMLMHKLKGDTVVFFHPSNSDLLFGRNGYWDLKKNDSYKLIDPDLPKRPNRIAFDRKTTVKALYYYGFPDSEGQVWLPGEKGPHSFIGWFRGADGNITISPNGKKLIYHHAGVVTLWDLELLARTKSKK
jgi:WD40 repeat protein